jgi:hypothetical protein
MKMKTYISLLLLLGTFAFQTQAQSVERVTVVIPGKFARSGSANRKPFDDKALAGLCEQGYTLAVYVYGGAKPHDVSCSKGKISYLSMTNWEKPGTILQKAEKAMNAGGKVMVHCWYGVHASNFVSAAALNKFCGYTGVQAANYFRAGVPNKSLPPARIDQLAGEIQAFGAGGSVMQGCPTPK